MTFQPQLTCCSNDLTTVDQFGYALSEHACKTAYDLGACRFLVKSGMSFLTLCPFDRVVHCQYQFLRMYVLPLFVLYLTETFILRLCYAAILTTRTWAVWGKRKWLTYALLGAFSFVWLSIFTIAGFYLEKTGREYFVILLNSITWTPSKDQASPAPQLIGCLLDSAGLYLVPCFALVVLYDMGV